MIALDESLITALSDSPTNSASSLDLNEAFTDLSDIILRAYDKTCPAPRAALSSGAKFMTKN